MASLLARVEIQFEERVLALGGFHPEGRAGRGIEVPLDGLAHLGVELVFGLCGCHGHGGNASPLRICQPWLFLFRDGVKLRACRNIQDALGDDRGAFEVSIHVQLPDHLEFFAGLENGANRNREFAFAWPAAPQSRATTLTGVIRSRPPQRGTKHLAP